MVEKIGIQVELVPEVVREIYNYTSGKGSGKNIMETTGHILINSVARNFPSDKAVIITLTAEEKSEVG